MNFGTLEFWNPETLHLGTLALEHTDIFEHRLSLEMFLRFARPKKTLALTHVKRHLFYLRGQKPLKNGALPINLLPSPKPFRPNAAKIERRVDRTHWKHMNM